MGRGIITYTKEQSHALKVREVQVKVRLYAGIVPIECKFQFREKHVEA